MWASATQRMSFALAFYTCFAHNCIAIDFHLISFEQIPVREGDRRQKLRNRILPKREEGLCFSEHCFIEANYQDVVDYPQTQL